MQNFLFEVKFFMLVAEKVIWMNCEEVKFDNLVKTF